MAETPKASPLPYALILAGMAVVGVVAIIIISAFRPDQDNATLIAVVIGLITTTSASILTLLTSRETHLSVNSRLDTFVETAEAAAQARGEAIGRADADARTDQLKKDE